MQDSDCGQSWGFSLIESCLEFAVFDPGLSCMRLHRLSYIGWGGVGGCRGGRGEGGLSIVHRLETPKQEILKQSPAM